MQVASDVQMRMLKFDMNDATSCFSLTCSRSLPWQLELRIAPMVRAGDRLSPLWRRGSGWIWGEGGPCYRARRARRLYTFATSDGRRQLNTEAFHGLKNKPAFKGHSTKQLVGMKYHLNACTWIILTSARCDFMDLINMRTESLLACGTWDMIMTSIVEQQTKSI